MNNDNLLQELADRVRNRFYGKYRGVVINVDASTMRIQASVPAVLPLGTTGWCMPCVPYAGPQVGFLMLPEVGSGVWIEFEGGDVSYPIWTGCFWGAGDIPSTASATTKIRLAPTSAGIRPGPRLRAGAGTVPAATVRLAARTTWYPAASRNSGVQPMMKKSATL